MTASRPMPRRRLVLGALASLALLAPARAPGQLTTTLPGISYEAALETLYEGDYTRAQRAMLREQRGAVRTVTARWVDSICYYAMHGEALYQLGHNREALAEFDRACQLYLAYPDWLRRVNFQQPPSPDNNPARRRAPWGRPARRVTYAELPQTMLVSQGQINNAGVAQRGGVVQAAQFWKVDVVEVVRATALAIRRRNELLGPLGPHDKISRDLANTLGRGGTTPPNHWSSAWEDLLAGLALMGVQKGDEAATHLSRAVLLGGRFDHDLTGAALLAQAQLAVAADDRQKVGALAAEAALAAYAYEDWDVLGEAMWLAHVHHLASGGQGVYAPLEPAATWASRTRLDHVAAMFRVALAEELATRREPDAASGVLSAAIARRSDIGAGRLGAFADYVGAMIAYGAKRAGEGERRLEQATSRYASLGHTNFQLGLCDARFDSGALSPRVAVDVYRTLLTDPSNGHWLLDPLGAIVSLRTNHEGSFDRWVTAALLRGETLPAIYAADLAKRRRFFSHQPIGGRLVALRGLLEASEERLVADQQLQRQALLQTFPEYAALSAEATRIQRNLADQKTLFSEETKGSDYDQFEQLAELSIAREMLLREMALRRAPTLLDFPPRRSAEETQKLMGEGEALLVFHQTGAAMHALLLTAKGEHYWRLPDAAPLRGKVSDLLEALGNYSASKVLTSAEVEESPWRRVASELGKTLLGESRLDLEVTERLVVVPDGPLWHLPMEVVVFGEPTDAKMIVEQTPVRYAPTMGLAFGDDRPFRPLRRTGVAINVSAGSSDAKELAAMTLRTLRDALPTAVALPAPLAAPSPVVASVLDALVVLNEVELDEPQRYAWSPLPLDRTRGAGAVSEWIALPEGGPQRLILGAAHTAAENAMKADRRGTRGAESLPPGRDLFHAACGLMASGVRTALVSRWTTGGAVHRQLVRELAAEWDRQPAPDAWRRSTLIARSSRIDPDQEPRFKMRNVGDSPPLAEHPFFWAGYVLLDTGYDPTAPEAPAPRANQEAGAGETGDRD